MITMTTWNCTGLARQTIDQITDSLTCSSIISMTETWLLSPLQFPSTWNQYHTYGLPTEGHFRGKMGITFLFNHSLQYHVTHFPSTFNYVLSCQVANTPIHCVYLPPSMTDAVAIELLQSLPSQTHYSQTNAVFCGNFNARHHVLLGDSRTTRRGTLMLDWMMEIGLVYWNQSFAFGIPTYNCQSRRETTGWAYTSVTDLFFSNNNLINPHLKVLQGSILSPFLYSIYINTIPTALRSIQMPTTSRVFDSMPRFMHNGFWINSLLYADDVVIIGAPETMLTPSSC